MPNWRPRKQAFWLSRAYAKSSTLAWVCIVVLLVADVRPTHAAAINFFPSAESLLAELVLGLVPLIAFALLARKRLKCVLHKSRQANELADHREYERNLAQQELIRRLEEERELAKEKLAECCTSHTRGQAEALPSRPN